MNKIGQLLKNEREKQGLSLEEVSLRIKVHAHKLKAIEENLKEELPAKVFIIGLIKSYAKELKMDVLEINRLCKEFYKDEIPKDDKVCLESKSEFTQFHWFGLFQFPKKAAMGISLFIILFLLIIIFSVIRKTNLYEKSYKRNNIEKYKKTHDNNSIDFEKKSDLLNSEKKEQNDDLTIKAKNLLQKEILDKKNNLQKTSPKERQIKKQIVQANNFMKTNKNTKPTSKKKYKEKSGFNVNSDNKLTMKALKPVQVEVIWSDGLTQKILLVDREKKILVFSKPIKVKISDGSAVLLSFNEDKEKIPGNSNEPVEINYP